METDWTPTEKAERHHGQAGSDMKPSRERNKQKRKEDPPPQKKNTQRRDAMNVLKAEGF